MSARIPRILALPVLGFAEFSDHGQETLVSGVELGLELGWVSPCVACEHLRVIRHDLVPMFLDITNRRLDLSRAEMKRDCDHVAVPPRLVIIENVVDGDPRPCDLGPSAAVDELRFE